MDNQIARRPLITGAPFFLRVNVPFTGLAGETMTVYTTAAQNADDLEIIGGITDLQSAQGQFYLNSIDNPLFSSEAIPLAMFFGHPDGPKPIVWWQPTTPLTRRQRIRIDLVNKGGEGAGTLIFVCRQTKVEAPMSQALMDYQGQGSQSALVLDSQFTTTLNETKQTSSARINDHFIWRTLHTTLAGASVRIFGINGRAWMDDYIPLWALAGRATSQIPNQPLQPPVFIPAGNTVSIEFKNEGVGGVAEDSGQAFLGGQRIPAPR